MEKKILVIDDDSVVRQSLIDYFEDFGWQVLGSGSAEEGLNLIDNTDFDCIIVDIRLPGMDGNDFIRKAVLKDKDTIFLTCTGSEQYQLPKDIIENKHVIKKIFRKPVSDLSELKESITSRINER